MCSLHLTHPSAHTPGAVVSRLCGARGAVVDFLLLGFEPTTLGYLGFQVQCSIHQAMTAIKMKTKRFIM